MFLKNFSLFLILHFKSIIEACPEKFASLYISGHYNILCDYEEEKLYWKYHFSEPHAPRNLRQTAVTMNTITVAWDAPEDASGEFEYLIIINEDGSPANTAVRAYLGILKH